MAHLSVQVGAALAVPIGTLSKASADTSGWKARCLRAASAMPPLKAGRSDMRVSGGAVIIAAALLAGCANTIPVPTTVVTAGMPNPEMALRQSMQHVDAEMAQLGGLQRADFEQAAGPTAAPIVPEDLQRVVSFAWTGPLDKGVAKLAQSIGYTFYTTAAPNSRPLNVAVQIHALSALQAFKALGEQAGTRATVEVDPQHHQVQVFHHV